MTDTFSLEVNNLSVHFAEDTLFKDVSLSMKAGDKATLSGPSGSGKSTLLRCIVGFTPFEGSIYINGESLNSHSVWRLRTTIAYVPQEPELGSGTVRDVLARPFSYRANHDIYFDTQQVDVLLEQFSLPPAILDKEMHTLSGGEKQRVALIAALLLKRPLLLLDEAASALDINSKQRVRDYLKALDNITMLSVSHDTRDFVLSDTILNLQELASGGLP